MNSSIKQQPLIAEILPGSLISGLFLLAYSRNHSAFWIYFTKGGFVHWLVASGLILLSSWIVGTFLDAIRNLLEECWDEKWRMNWNFFFDADIGKVHQLEEYYYAYYTLDANFAIGLLIFGMAKLLNHRMALIGSLPGWSYILLVFVFIIFFLDACRLREEMRTLIGCSSQFPHMNVFTRLKCSDKHGVGVFAIRDIPKGTNIFNNDNSKMVQIDENAIRNLSPEIKKLYNDFCVIKGSTYWCPENFNNLTVAWYLNESKDSPNVLCAKDYDFIATRDIKKDEELLIDYAGYSDYPGSEQ